MKHTKARHGPPMPLHLHDTLTVERTYDKCVTKDLLETLVPKDHRLETTAWCTDCMQFSM